MDTIYSKTNFHQVAAQTSESKRFSKLRNKIFRYFYFSLFLTSCSTYSIVDYKNDSYTHHATEPRQPASLSLACDKIFLNSSPAPLLVSEENAAQLSAKYLSFNSVPEGTLFSSLKAAEIFYDIFEERRAPREKPLHGQILHAIYSPELSTREVRGTSVVLNGTYNSYIKYQSQLVNRSFEACLQLGTESLLYGFFMRQSLFAEIATGNGKFDSHIDLIKKVSEQPALEWNPNGTLTLWRKNKTSRILARIQEKLSGKNLKVFRSQSRTQILLQLLLKNYAEKKDISDLSRQYLKELKTELNLLKIDADFGHPNPELAQQSQFRYNEEKNFISRLESIHDQETFLRTIHQRNIPPYLFTTPQKSHAEYFLKKDFQLIEYSVNLTELPKWYQDKIYISPDGLTMPYSIEIDFPFSSFEEALVTSKALKMENTPILD